MEVFFSSIDYVWKISLSYFFLVKVSCGNCFTIEILKAKNYPCRAFPVSLVVRILGFHCQGPGSIPGWGTEILQTTATWLEKKEKKDILYTCVCVCVTTCVKYFDPKFLFSSFEKLLGIFCVLVAMLNAVVTGVNKMSIALIDHDMFGCRHRKLTLIGLRS